jgi:hypothetical protein
VTSITRNDVEGFMHDVAAGKTATREKTKPRGLSVVRGGRGVAGRTVALLGAIFTYAVRQGHRIDNPAHGVVKFATGRRERRLTDDEYHVLGLALSKADQERGLEARRRCHMVDGADWLATRRSAGPAMV